MKKVDDFFDFSRMSIPKGVYDAHQRVTYNLSYFTSNYFAIAFLFFLYCIFTNIPFFLFVAVELVVIYFVQRSFGNTDEINLKFFRLHKNIWFSLLLIINIPLLFFWSPLSTVFWLSIFSGSIILAHAALVDKPVEAAYSNAV
ncbi:hypothetical protein C6P40_004391 [Pichia californica]|uniref:PRA1 family protein n=1 Tax=Pichia californica TaxID=460514 RepID=A0A9P7BEW0_9ASCO|nr:hypothetical protein C6P42_005101 [[Candida] californica]KAG0689822.1 hypothetical protein C6P40_004391 [[Candida] californica]